MKSNISNVAQIVIFTLVIAGGVFMFQDDVRGRFFTEKSPATLTGQTDTQIEIEDGSQISNQNTSSEQNTTNNKTSEITPVISPTKKVDGGTNSKQQDEKTAFTSDSSIPKNQINVDCVGFTECSNKILSCTSFNLEINQNGLITDQKFEATPDKGKCLIKYDLQASKDSRRIHMSRSCNVDIALLKENMDTLDKEALLDVVSGQPLTNLLMRYLTEMTSTEEKMRNELGEYTKYLTTMKYADNMVCDTQVF